MVGGDNARNASCRRLGDVRRIRRKLGRLAFLLRQLECYRQTLIPKIMPMWQDRELYERGCQETFFSHGLEDEKLSCHPAPQSLECSCLESFGCSLRVHSHEHNVVVRS